MNRISIACVGCHFARWVLCGPICLAWANDACAALVYITGRQEPIAGYVDRSDPQVVVIREPLPDGSQREHRVPQGDVEDVVETVSRSRLEALSPRDPTAYRDYAEELAEKRRDPEARETGLRLFLIAAHLKPDQLGRSCFLGMARLAVTPAEARRYRAMAYLLDPKHDRSVLGRKETAETPPAARNDRDRMLLKALQFLRRGEGRRARMQADLPEVKTAFQDWSKVLSYEEFVQATKDELTTPTLSKLLQLELMLQQSTAEGRADNGQQDAPWSEVVGRDGTPPVFPLTLETVTRWDPAECLYRDRQWVRPEGTDT